MYNIRLLYSSMVLNNEKSRESKITVNFKQIIVKHIKSKAMNRR